MERPRSSLKANRWAPRTPARFWRVISEHKVSNLFTAPTALRAIKREDPDGEHLKRYDMSGFKALFLAGERSDPDTIRWAETLLNVPVVDHWWQTETGWAIAGNPLGIEAFAHQAGIGDQARPGLEPAGTRRCRRTGGTGRYRGAGRQAAAAAGGNADAVAGAGALQDRLYDPVSTGTT